LIAKEDNKGVTMIDDNESTKDDEILDLGDESEGEAQIETEDVNGEAVKTAWVI
jgi:hypothetical protein